MTVVKIRKSFPEDVMEVINILSSEHQSFKKQNNSLVQEKISSSSVSFNKTFDGVNDETIEVEETKAMTFSNFDDLLEYIGENENTTNEKNKKNKKKKHKSTQPISNTSTQVSNNTPNKSSRKQNKESKENDEFVEEFKKLLFLNSVHNNLITKEEPEFDDKWVGSLGC